MRRALALLWLIVPGAVRAQETSALARPEPVVPILWLAPPPAPEAAPEDRPMPMLTLLIPPPPNPNAVALPPAARALLEQAIDANNPTGFAALAKLARDTYPNGAAQIDALSAENDAKAAEKKAADARAKADALAAASFLDNWKGEAEIGGSLETGPTRNIALYGALKLNKEGLRWRHMLSGRADFQKTNGTTTTDRDIAAYQPQYKLDDRLYIYGLGQFEHDRFLGYDQRYTASSGLGYTVFRGPRLKLDVEAGPAGRRTVYIAAPDSTRVAARGSVNLTWKPNPVVTLTSVTALFIESHNNNITSNTSLDTKLFGPLKARLSYNVTYEDDTPDVSHSIDTITRASLVYDF